MRLLSRLSFFGLAFAGLLFAACSSGQGPLIINKSGGPAELTVWSETGETFEGTCADQDAVWTGRSGSATVRVEIRMAGQTYRLEGDELRVPFGKDKATAFILEAAGPRKLTVREAEILLRER